MGGGRGGSVQLAASSSAPLPADLPRSTSSPSSDSSSPISSHPSPCPSHSPDHTRGGGGGAQLAGPTQVPHTSSRDPRDAKARAQAVEATGGVAQPAADPTSHERHPGSVRGQAKTDTRLQTLLDPKALGDGAGGGARPGRQENVNCEFWFREK